MSNRACLIMCLVAALAGCATAERFVSSPFGQATVSADGKVEAKLYDSVLDKRLSLAEKMELITNGRTKEITKSGVPAAGGPMVTEVQTFNKDGTLAANPSAGSSTGTAQDAIPGAAQAALLATGAGVVAKIAGDAAEAVANTNAKATVEAAKERRPDQMILKDIGNSRSVSKTGPITNDNTNTAETGAVTTTVEDGDTTFNDGDTNVDASRRRHNDNRRYNSPTVNARTDVRVGGNNRGVIQTGTAAGGRDAGVSQRGRVSGDRRRQTMPRMD